MVWTRSKQMLKNERGMTLIELLAVVVILGIIATIAGIAVVNASDNAKQKADMTQISILKDAAQRYLFEEDKKVDAAGVTITAVELVNKMYLTEIPTDSAKQTFVQLQVKLENDKGLVWTFSTDAANNDQFAPKAPADFRNSPSGSGS